MMIRPTLLQDFIGAENWLDPRWTISRASAASYVDRLGIIRTRPANTMRFTHLADGTPIGVRGESGAETNLLLWSEALDNAAWTKTNATVSADTTLAPDGNTTADTLTATGASGNAAQAVTITAGQNPVLEFYAKAGVTNWVRANLSDGTNNVTVWFNLATGAMGTHTAGAGTLLYVTAGIKPAANGFYRCSLLCSSTTVTAITASVQPCSADNTAAANTNAAAIWGLQCCALGRAMSVSYTATTSATVLKTGDAMSIGTLDASWFNPNEGTYFLDFQLNALYGGTGLWMLGHANTAADLVGIFHAWNYGAANVSSTFNIIAGGVSQFAINDAVPFTDETPLRIAACYSKTAAGLISVNGRAVVSSGGAPASWPAAPARMTLGGLPSTTSYSDGHATRRMAYFPKALSAAQLQLLSA